MEEAIAGVEDGAIIGVDDGVKQTRGPASGGLGDPMASSAAARDNPTLREL